MSKPESTVLRTPDTHFDNLPGYTFAPHYTELAAFPDVRYKACVRPLWKSPKAGILCKSMGLL